MICSSVNRFFIVQFLSGLISTPDRHVANLGGSARRHIRGKWACAQCDQLVQAAGGGARDRQGRHPHPRPSRAGAGGQYADHLPSSRFTLASTPGAASWSVTTTPTTRPCLARAPLKVAALRTHGASSTRRGSTTRARRPRNHPARCLASCTKLNAHSLTCQPTSAEGAIFKARRAADALHAWLKAHQQKIHPGSATVIAMDYGLERWQSLVRQIGDATCRWTATGRITRSADCHRAQQLAICRLVSRG